MTENLYKSKPHSDPARWVVVYPCYLNSKKTAEEGRKIAKSIAVENPTAHEIFDILHAAGFQCNGEKKMHPRDPERDNMALQGRIRVQIKKDDGTPINKDVANRIQLYRYIAGLIPKLKSRQPGGAPSGTTPSTVGGQSGGGKKTNKKKK